MGSRGGFAAVSQARALSCLELRVLAAVVYVLRAGIPLTITIFPAIQDLKMCMLNYNQAVWMNNHKHPLDLIIVD